MPRKVDPRIIEVDEEPEQGDEVADLRAQLTQSQEQAEELARRLIVFVEPGMAMRLYPLILAVMIVGRLVSLVYIEDSGKSGKWVGIGEDALYLVGSIVVIARWLAVGWKAIKWHLIPQCVVVLTAMLGAVAIYSHKLLEGDTGTPDGNPVIASGIAILGLLFVASPAIERGLGAIQSFLDHPIEALKKVHIL